MKELLLFKMRFVSGSASLDEWQKFKFLTTDEVCKLWSTGYMKGVPAVMKHIQQLHPEYKIEWLQTKYNNGEFEEEFVVVVCPDFG